MTEIEKLPPSTCNSSGKILHFETRSEISGRKVVETGKKVAHHMLKPIRCLFPEFKTPTANHTDTGPGDTRNSNIQFETHCCVRLTKNTVNSDMVCEKSFYNP